MCSRQSTLYLTVNMRLLLPPQLPLSQRQR
jgi:hypothetical protein